MGGGGGGWWPALINVSGEGVAPDSFFLPNDGKPNLLSREDPLVFGGGGKDWFEDGSGDGR